MRRRVLRVSRARRPLLLLASLLLVLAVVACSDEGWTEHNGVRCPGDRIGLMALDYQVDQGWPTAEEALARFLAAHGGDMPTDGWQLEAGRQAFTHRDGDRVDGRLDLGRNAGGFRIEGVTVCP